MSVTPAQIKELRERTSAGLMACKKALEESNGDMDGAIEILRKRGGLKAAEKSSRSTGEGCVAINGRAMIKLLCETDFVAKNEDFIAFAQELADKAAVEGVDAVTNFFESAKGDKIQAMGENLVLEFVDVLQGGDTVSGYVHSNRKLGALVVLEGGDAEKAKDVAMHVTAMDPMVANPSDVPAEAIEKEKAIYKEQLAAEGKPEQIWDKIMEGKVNKFCAERALTSQSFVKDPSMTVQEYLGDAKVLMFIREVV